jgi:GDP-mannose transporter
MADDKKRGDYVVELGDKQPNGHFQAAPKPPPPSMQTGSIAGLSNNPVVSILTYCASSILMTVANKYVVSGTGFNLNFFLLAIQVFT